MIADEALFSHHGCFFFRPFGMAFGEAAGCICGVMIRERVMCYG